MGLCPDRAWNDPFMRSTHRSIARPTACDARHARTRARRGHGLGPPSAQARATARGHGVIISPEFQRKLKQRRPSHLRPPDGPCLLEVPGGAHKLTPPLGNASIPAPSAHTPCTARRTHAQLAPSASSRTLTRRASARTTGRRPRREARSPGVSAPAATGRREPADNRPLSSRDRWGLAEPPHTPHTHPLGPLSDVSEVNDTSRLAR